MIAGLLSGRTDKQCRERWHNHLNFGIRKVCFKLIDLPMTTILGPESAFFKQHYRSDWHNRGAMIKEIDVIRQQEGW